MPDVKIKPAPHLAKIFRKQNKKAGLRRFWDSLFLKNPVHKRRAKWLAGVREDNPVTFKEWADNFKNLGAASLFLGFLHFSPIVRAQLNYFEEWYVVPAYLAMLAGWTFAVFCIMQTCAISLLTAGENKLRIKILMAFILVIALSGLVSGFLLTALGK